MSELLKHLKTITILTIPAWGVFLSIITLRAFPHNVTETVAKILDQFGFGYILPILIIGYGFSPIYKTQWSLWLKTLLGFIYFGYAALAIFIFGWMGACINTSCH